MNEAILAQEERPEYRLETFGPESLTDAEVLAMIAGTTKKRSHIEKCRETLLYHGGIKGIARRHWKEIGLSPSRSRAIVAAIELSRRAERDQTKDLFFRDPASVASHFGPMLRDLQQERFYLVCLNAAKKVTNITKISEGGATATVVDPVIIFRIAILQEARSIILVHNHPSGNRRASRSDIVITQKIESAAANFDITVDDHVIIAGMDYLSLRTEGLF